VAKVLFGSSGHLGRDLAEHFLGLRKTPRDVLAVDEPAVGLDVKNAAAAFDELSLDSELLVDGVRQTGGLGGVVSLHAVFDGDLHRSFLLLLRQYTAGHGRSPDSGPRAEGRGPVKENRRE
jgi:hypothetical protein